LKKASTAENCRVEFCAALEGIVSHKNAIFEIIEREAIMLILFIIVPVVVIVILVLLYNQLVRRRTMVREGWSGIQVQLKRRYDLIPNLVETVKGYRGHEQALLTQLTEARTRCLSAQGVNAQVEAENGLTRSLKSLFAVAEAYPDLKANQNFLELQKQLADIEEQLQMSRRYYNATVRDYNILVNTFPGILVSRLFVFSEAAFFEGSTEESQIPKVGF
jgi:LemA protein